MKIAVSSFLALFLICGCYKVNDNKVQNIEMNISELSNFGKPGQNNSLDVDKLIPETSNFILELVNKEKRELHDIAGLSEDAFFKKEITIYSFGYDSGGTRGFVTYPIILWRYKDDKGATNLSEMINCRFEKIIELNESQKIYLLIGQEKGDGSCYQNIAYVIKIEKDFVDVEYPAFAGRPYLNFCNGNFMYDQETKTLHFKIKNDTSPEKLGESFFYQDKYGMFGSDSISAKKLTEIIAPEYYETRGFSLSFNGKEFVD